MRKKETYEGMLLSSQDSKRSSDVFHYFLYTGCARKAVKNKITKTSLLLLDGMY